MRPILLSGLSLVAILASVPAIAQSEPENDAGEIIVTAQRREQRLQDVPVAASVVSGSALSAMNINNLQDLSTRMPNVRLVSSNSVDFLSIRGISSGQNQAFEQAVGTFVDGLYRGRSRSSRAALFDIERVEVLKGPQTTFFGNNAIAGALNITTRKPGHAFAANMSALYAQPDGEFTLEGGVTVPISSTLSARGAVRWAGMDGFIRNSLLNEDAPRQRNLTGRVSIAWEPSTAFESLVRLDRYRARDKGALSYELLDCPPDPAYGAPRGACAAYLSRSGGVVDDELNYETAMYDTPFRYDMLEAAWTNRVKLDGLTISSITGYFDHDFKTVVQLVPTTTPGHGGAGANPTTGYEFYKQFSQELRLESDSDRSWQWMAGAYFSREHYHHLQYTGFYQSTFGALAGSPYTATSPVVGRTGLDQVTRTLSAFAALTFEFAVGFKLNAGIRYTDVRKEGHRATDFGIGPGIPSREEYLLLSTAANAAIAAAGGASLADFAQTVRVDRKLMPTVSLQYQFSRDLMAYASYSKGFKSGGYSASARGDVYGPESVNAYETGLKGSIIDRRLSFNLALFLSDFSDLQESSSIYLPGGLIQSVIANAAAARTKGIELGANLRLASSLQLYADVAYLSSRYRNYPIAPCTVFDQARLGSTCVQDMSGKKRPFAPDYSGNIGARVSVPVGANTVVKFEPSLFYTSGFFQSSTADPLLFQDGFIKVDGRLSIGEANQRWELALIGKNLGDRATAAIRTQLNTSPGSMNAVVDRARSVALQFSSKF